MILENPEMNITDLAVRIVAFVILDRRNIASPSELRGGFTGVSQAIGVPPKSSNISHLW